jgi:ABC-type lipoprotein release transport system permease subunit
MHHVRQKSEFGSGAKQAYKAILFFNIYAQMYGAVYMPSHFKILLVALISASAALAIMSIHGLSVILARRDRKYAPS